MANPYILPAYQETPIPSSSPNTTITTTTLPSSDQRPSQPLPASFLPGPKPSRDGKHTYHKRPEREAFDARWREAVARGEDPKQNLVKQVEATGSSSFIEKGWRKVRGKKGTRAQEKVAREERAREREERGELGLLAGGGDEERGWEGEGEEERDGIGGGIGGGGSGGGEKGSHGEVKGKGKGKWHDRLRWGL